MEVPHSRRNRSPLLASTNLCPLRRCSDGRGSGGRTLGTACKSGKRVGAPTCAGRRDHGHRVQGYRSEKKVAPGSGCTQRVRSGRHSQSVARVLHKPLHQEGVGKKWQASAKKHNETQKRAKRLDGDVRRPSKQGLDHPFTYLLTAQNKVRHAVDHTQHNTCMTHTRGANVPALTSPSLQPLKPHGRL